MQGPALRSAHFSKRGGKVRAESIAPISVPSKATGHFMLGSTNFAEGGGTRNGEGVKRGGSYNL